MTTDKTVHCETGTVQIAGRDWAKLLVTVSTVTATVLIFFFQQTTHIERRLFQQIEKLDVRWQDRISVIVSSVDSDLQDIKSSIPPDWFRKMVEGNRDEIDRLEDEFTRDFVRKDELEAVLRRKEKP